MPTPKRRKLHFSPPRNSCSDMIIVQKWVFWSLGQRLYLAWPPRVNPELCSLSLLDLDGNIYFQKNEKKVSCLSRHPNGYPRVPWNEYEAFLREDYKDVYLIKEI